MAAVACPVAASASPRLPAGARPDAAVDGSSFAGVAIQQWVGQSATLYGLNINWQVSSSVIGLNNFAQAQVDFAASDIPYSSQQSTYYPTQPYQYMPDVAGGLAFMYNLNGNDGQRITNLILTRPWSPDLPGRDHRLERPGHRPANPQLAGDLPGRNIIPVYRSDASGENYLLSDYLLHQDGAEFTAAQNAFNSGQSRAAHGHLARPPRSTPMPDHLPGLGRATWSGRVGSDNAANYVAAVSSLGSITYVETAYAKEHNFPVASLINASGNAVQPTSLNVATALESGHPPRRPNPGPHQRVHEPLPNAYPLSAYSYLVAPARRGWPPPRARTAPPPRPGRAPDRPHVAVPAAEGPGARAVRRLPGLRRPGEDATSATRRSRPTWSRRTSTPSGG